MSEKAYEAKITNASRELTAKEKIMMKDISDAIQIDDATKEDSVIIPVDMYAVLSVHNEKSDTKDYEKYIIVDKQGVKYVTGSESFFRSFMDIVDEMTDAGEEEITIRAYRKPSKNYVGKDFLTCSIV